MEIMFKNKTRLGSNFHFKDRIAKECGECVRHFNVGIGEHFGISPLAKKQVPSKNSTTANHLLVSNHSAFFQDNFSILTLENKTFLPEQHHCTCSGGPSHKIFVRIL